MALDAETIKLLDELGISGDDRAKAEEAFSIPSLADGVRKGFMRQSDYSRKQDELKKKSDQLEANWKKANDEYLRMQTDLESTQAERDAAAAKLTDAEKKLSEAPQIDLTKVLTPDQFQEKMNTYAAGQTAYFSDVLEIIADHASLFPGEKLNPKQLIRESMEAKKTPADYWSEKYKVEEKRTELAAAAETKKQQEWEEKGYKKRLDEEANPATRTLSSSKNPFYTPEDEKVSPWDDPTPFKAEQDLLNEIQSVVRG